MMAVWLISYFLIGAFAFFIFHRYIRDGHDDVGDHVVGFIILFIWPFAAVVFAIVAGVMGIVSLGNRIKGE